MKIPGQLQPKHYKALKLIEEGALSLKKIAQLCNIKTGYLYDLYEGDPKTGQIGLSFQKELQKLGVNAVGLSGLDGRLLEGKRKSMLRIVENGKRKILRGEYSGKIEKVNAGLLEALLTAGYTPVVAPLAISYESEGLNVDGDRVAAAIGSALRAEKIVILSNVPGLLRNYPDESTLIPHIPAEQAGDYLDRYARGRMKRKLLGAVEALRDGVGQVTIADGRIDRPVQAALSGQGTVIE